MRPATLDEYAGQGHLLGEGKFITQIVSKGKIPSLLFWGPPGSGKTTLAHLLAKKLDYEFIVLSAVTAGIKDVKEVVSEAKQKQNHYGKKTLLFLDEIHRFNKAQQDSLLPHLEDGAITLIGATTENPSFEVIAPLLSRCRVLVLQALSTENLKNIVTNAMTDKHRGLGLTGQTLSDSALNMLVQSAEGDGRRVLTTLEIASLLAGEKNEITESHIETAFQRKILTHDKKGEDHYNLISAFIKSMRGSDPDAAVYYMARLLEAGEDALFIIRRMVIFASEDIGNANPNALNLAISTMQSFHFVGLAEGWIPMAQLATYLASSPKSNASYMAYKEAVAEIATSGQLPVPLHLRNAPTKMMKEMGYGKDYKYAHDYAGHIVDQVHLPDEIKNKKFYKPEGIGFEQNILAWLDKRKK